MAEATRRDFLAFAGVGAIAVGGAALGSEALSRMGSSGEANVGAAGPADGGLIVAYLSDVKSGAISIVAGEQEFTVVDTVLAAKLASIVSGR